MKAGVGRSRISPVAPAQRTRAISSSVNRMIPRWLFAFPVLNRMCSTSPLPARVAISDARRNVPSVDGPSPGGRAPGRYARTAAHRSHRCCPRPAVASDSIANVASVTASHEKESRRRARISRLHSATSGRLSRGPVSGNPATAGVWQQTTGSVPPGATSRWVSRGSHHGRVALSPRWPASCVG